jgi:pyruvate dehydrogenase E1 component alpha subunit
MHGRGCDRSTLERLFRLMVRSRAVDEASAELWHAGAVSGELHLGIGEEAVSAGVVGHLVPGDGLAADHRGTPPLICRGVDPEALIGELIGSPAGLCAGAGGHMHLLDPGLRAATDGIVGASAPLACGFALRAQRDDAGGVAVAFFGEGAMNQGMVLEALNLAVVWALPVVFVVKDSGLAITTRKRDVTAGDLLERARAFDMPAHRMPGRDVGAVWKAASRAIARARGGGGPSLLLARVHRPDGHFLGDPLLRTLDHPVEQAAVMAPPLIRGLMARPGATASRRLAGLNGLRAAVTTAAAERSRARNDPLAHTRRQIRSEADRIEAEERGEVAAAVDRALKTAGVSRA